MGRVSKAWEHANKICKLYVDDQMSLRKLSRKYGCTLNAVSKILRKNDIAIRVNKHSEAWRHVDKICSMYIDKRMSSIEISDIYGCSFSTILSILETRDIKRRPGASNSTSLTNLRPKTEIWEKSDEICKLFTETNLTCVSLGKKYGVSYQTIRRILQHNNIDRRHRIWNHQEGVCDMYENQKNHLTEISEYYGANRLTVIRVLESNNVVLR